MSVIYIPGMEMPTRGRTCGRQTMDDCEYYDPDYCDGNFCPRDCEHCPIADKIISALSKMEEEEEE